MKSKFLPVAIFSIVAATLCFSNTSWTSEGHEHTAGGFFNVQWGLQGLQNLMNVHPLFVHFPIALLLAAVALYVVGTITKRESLFVAGKWSLFLGTLGAAFAVLTGLQAAKTVPHAGETHQIMMAHQYLGITVLILSFILSLWVLISKANIPARGRTLFLAVLVALAAILTQQADLGGRMVFMHGVGVGKKSMMTQEAEASHHQQHAGEQEHGHEGHAH